MTTRLSFVRSTIGALLCMSAVGPALAQDRADIDPTRIIGSGELPKVLYIVPWKKPLPGSFNGRPPVSVLDEALAPIDRDAFRRQLRYDAQAQVADPGARPGTAAANTAPAAP